MNTAHDALKNLSVLLVTAFMIISCSRQPAETPEPEPSVEPATPILPANAALLTLTTEALESQMETLDQTRMNFMQTITQLLSQPDKQQLSRAQQSWQGLYQAWNQNYGWLAAASADTHKAHLQRTDPLPIFPGYVDGLSLWPESGIVNDTTVSLNIDNLLAQQDYTLEGETTVGFQVIQFLLFAEPEHPRQASDFQSSDREARPANHNEQSIIRRRHYLQLSTELLVDDLASLSSHVRSGDNALLALPLLLESLHLSSQRLLQLQSLQGLHDPADGPYLSESAWQVATLALDASLQFWQRDDLSNALIASLPDNLDGFSDNLEALLREDSLNLTELTQLLQERPEILR